MKNKNLEKAFTVLGILKKYTDVSHIISMPELIAELSQYDINVDRRTIYTIIEELKEAGYDIRYIRAGKQGYYYVPTFSNAEILVMIDAIKNNQSISEKESNALTKKIVNTFGDLSSKVITPNPNKLEKTDNENVLINLKMILDAIENANHIYFYYYDLTIHKRRKYRHKKKKYYTLPYAIVNQNGRYYCIGYDEEKQNYIIYRLDKMDGIEKDSEMVEKNPFDIESFLQSSFHMYKGEAQTITCEFTSDMANAVIDQFGTNFITNSVSEESFTISIRSAITPTLITWLMQYGDKVRVLKPQSLIDELLKTAKGVIEIYDTTRKN